jgi:hypothetical protein
MAWGTPPANILPTPSSLDFYSPISENPVGNDGKACSAVCPFEDFWAFGDFGAEFLWMRHHINSSKIESIRIPTSLNGDIGFRMPIGMKATSGMEQVEVVIEECEELAPKLCCQFCTTLAMPIIKAFIDSPGVVEDGEQLHNFNVGSSFLRKSKSNLQHSSPMRNTMRPIDGQGIIFENGVDEGLEVEHGSNHFFIISATRVCILSKP